MAKLTSDHVPCKIVIGTCIPKSNIFRFENFWPQHPGFLETTQEGWAAQVRNSKDAATVLAGKLKNTRQKLKPWSKQLSNLAHTSHCVTKSFSTWMQQKTVDLSSSLNGISE